MSRYFTRTFFFFLFGFLAIISVAFAVAAYVGTTTQPPVDNTATHG